MLKMNFLAKFQAVAAELNASSHRDVESLKFRASTSDSDYKALLADLGSLTIVAIKGDYDGKAWKLTDANDNSIIIVEHETGLEILYVAGAVASIVSLVPIIVGIWNGMRDHWPPLRERFGTGRPERRRFNKNDRLIEELAPPVEAIILQHLLNQYDKLSDRISSLETEVSGLKNRIDSPPQSVVRKRRAKSSGVKTDRVA